MISSMPGPPPRQHKHERQYTPSTLSVKPTRRRWNDDDDGQMIFRDLGGLKFPDICLTGEEKPRKNLTQETCPDRGSNPGPLRDKRACYHLLHSGGHTEQFEIYIQDVPKKHRRLVYCAGRRTDHCSRRTPVRKLTVWVL